MVLHWWVLYWVVVPHVATIAFTWDRPELFGGFCNHSSFASATLLVFPCGIFLKKETPLQHRPATQNYMKSAVVDNKNIFNIMWRASLVLLLSLITIGFAQIPVIPSFVNYMDGYNKNKQHEIYHLHYYHNIQSVIMQDLKDAVELLYLLMLV